MIKISPNRQNKIFINFAYYLIHFRDDVNLYYLELIDFKKIINIFILFMKFYYNFNLKHYIISTIKI